MQMWKSARAHRRPTRFVVAVLSGVGQGEQARETLVSEMKHVYEVRPRKDHRGVDLMSDALPFGRSS